MQVLPLIPWPGAPPKGTNLLLKVGGPGSILRGEGMRQVRGLAQKNEIFVEYVIEPLWWKFSDYA